MPIREQNLITKNAMNELNQSQRSFASEKKKESAEIFKSMAMPKEKEEGL